MPGRAKARCGHAVRNRSMTAAFFWQSRQDGNLGISQETVDLKSSGGAGVSGVGAQPVLGF